MSKNTTAYMHLYQYDGDFYIKYDGSASCTPDDTGHKIGKDNMKIQVDSTELGSGDVYSFTIRKKDGAFCYRYRRWQHICTAVKDCGYR